jgi:prephenate dehydrogenase
VRAHVIGLGLVGSSVALGLRARGAEVTGEDVDPARAERAEELGAIASVGRAPDDGIVVVATPASSVVEVAGRVLAEGTEGLVVTDVAGVKGQIAAELPDSRFVPGHPMAGSEQEGPDGADPDLFVGATWVLTPTRHTSEAAFSTVKDVVSLLGADVVVLPPDRHDELVAVVSHVPHLAAATLMSLAADSPVDREALMRLAAGGFRDMTRIAAGSSAIWPDICRDNAAAIVPALDRLIARLEDVRGIVAGADQGGLVTLLERARVARRNLPARGAPPPQGTELRLVVPDRPGVLAEVTSTAAELGVNIYDIEIAHSSEGPRGVLVLVVASGAAGDLVGRLRSKGYRVAAMAEGTVEAT